jgi:hypothetical protein
MNQHHGAAIAQPFPVANATMPERARPPAEMTVERLPFTISIVQSSTELRQAVAVRHGAYARHVPAFAETLQVPESSDLEDGVAVLLASSKLDGSPLGTMRIQTNRFKPLGLEESLALPQWLAARPLAEAARLGVTEERAGRLVKSMLFKAYFQYCQLHEIEWMVITARSPVDRTYDRLLFDDVYPGLGYIPLHHVNNMPHRVMKFEVGTAQERWAKVGHPMYDFIFCTNHPDIDLRVNGSAAGHAFLPSHPINAAGGRAPTAHVAYA